jgi:hypothetical protein
VAYSTTPASVSADGGQHTGLPVRFIDQYVAAYTDTCDARTPRLRRGTTSRDGCRATQYLEEAHDDDTHDAVVERQ